MRALGQNQLSWQPSTPLSGGALAEGPQGAQIYGVRHWFRLGDPAKVRNLRELAEEYANDPRIRWQAASIVQGAGAGQRDYPAQAKALLSWVQHTIYYTHEKGEQLQTPWRTLQVKTGDCFAEGTLVLRDDMEFVPVERIQAGDRIWGRDRWSVVTDAWAKGVLPVTRVDLSNGSTLRLTEDHKVYVYACAGPKQGQKAPGARMPSRRDHGPQCAGRGWHQCAQKYGVTVERIHISELRKGMRLLQPEQIQQPHDFNAVSADRSWLLGAFAAEGWAEGTRAAISGLDGTRKEATKHRVQQIAERYGWKTRWHRKYIAINNAQVAQHLAACGTGATNKCLPAYALGGGDLHALAEGLDLDAGKNTHGRGWTYSTTSSKLGLQYRVLQRMLGRSTSTRWVAQHGGFGTNPIMRIGVQVDSPQPLKVRAIHRDAEHVPTYDLSTDDHYVYLPEADCTVSNCDDSALLLASLASSIGLQYRFVLGGRDKGGKMVRWIEGAPFQKAQFFHIYVQLGWPPTLPSHWHSAEPTLRGAPLGYDLIVHGINMDHHGKASLPARLPRTMGGIVPEIQAPQRVVRTNPGQSGQFYGSFGAAESSPLAPKEPWLPKGFWKDVALRTIEGVIGAVVIYYVMQSVKK